MFWHAMPPELNTARLMAGAGPEPMVQTASGWAALAVMLENHAVDLATALVSLKGLWTGAGSDKAAVATAPMVKWLYIAAAYAQRRAQQASAQATSYAAALGTTPSLPEIAVNHITHAVLSATNFFGINMVPIGFNETDYFVRMWNQAGVAMDGYQAATIANTTFEPLPPPPTIIAPGMEEALQTWVAAKTAAMTAQAPPQFVADFPQISGDIGPLPFTPIAAPTAKINFQGLIPSNTPETPTDDSSTTPAIDQFAQIIGQAGTMNGIVQRVSQPIQQATSMFSQVGSIGGSSASAADKPETEMGLLGTSPLSEHPLLGGSGATIGAGLLRAQSLPGAGGSAPRTPLLAQLVDKPSTAGVRPAVMANGAGSVSSGAGTSAMGGAAPMAPIGGAAQSTGSRSGLAAPAVLTRDPRNGALDEFDDQDDW